MANIKERKAFNFYASYYDVFKELSDSDKLKFIEAILAKQFNDIEPTLKGMAKFAYLSQKHSIDKQVEGFKTKTKSELPPPTQDPCQGGTQAPLGQEEVQVQVQEKEELKRIISNIYNSYPSKCPVRLSSNGKTTSDKVKIKSLLKDISETKLINTIDWYVKECIESKTYMKNFKTFLNNLPDIEDFKPIEEKLYKYKVHFTLYKNKTEKQYQQDLKQYGNDLILQ